MRALGRIRVAAHHGFIVRDDEVTVLREHRLRLPAVVQRHIRHGFRRRRVCEGHAPQFAVQNVIEQIRLRVVIQHAGRVVALHGHFAQHFHIFAFQFQRAQFHARLRRVVIHLQGEHASLFVRREQAQVFIAKGMVAAIFQIKPEDVVHAIGRAHQHAILHEGHADVHPGVFIASVFDHRLKVQFRRQFHAGGLDAVRLFQRNGIQAAALRQGFTRLHVVADFHSHQADFAPIGHDGARIEVEIHVVLLRRLHGGGIQLPLGQRAIRVSIQRIVAEDIERAIRVGHGLHLFVKSLHALVHQHRVARRGQRASARNRQQAQRQQNRDPLFHRVPILSYAGRA